MTEGVSAFDELSGSAPVSIRQQALRGLAKIALERNDTVAAKAQYERILGKALMGRGRPAEHWAHSEYAWLVFEDGDLQVAASLLPCLVKASFQQSHKRRWQGTDGPRPPAQSAERTVARPACSLRRSTCRFPVQ